MAKLPNQKRILREDIQEAPNWIVRLLTPLNSFMETVYYALNKDITFTENIACQIKTVDFSTPSNYTSASPKTDGFVPLQFTHTLRNKPQGVMIMQLVEEENTGTVITSAVSLDWYEINGTVYISYITGLKDSTEYSIKLLVI